MTNEQARRVFDTAIAKSANSADLVAKLELCREYFCNPEFKAALEEEIWKLSANH